MRVALLFHRGYFPTLDELWPPLGLAYLISWVRAYHPGDWEFTILPADRHAELDRFRPEVVGITTYTQDFTQTARLVAQLRSRYDPLIVLGGHHITALPRTLPPEADLAVLGEGEQTFGELLARFPGAGRDVHAYRDIAGLAYRADDAVVQTATRPRLNPLDRVPLPAREYLDLHPRETHVISSRGCPYTCSFCSCPSFWGAPRSFSPPRITEELTLLADEYGIERVYFLDDLFTVNLKRLAALAEAIVAGGLHRRLQFSANTRSELFTEDVARTLKRAGFVGIGMGLESASPAVLKFLKTGGISVDSHQRALDLARQYGFHVSAPFILGTPVETPADIRMTIEFYRRNAIDFTNIYFLAPFPGTPVWEEALRRGVVSPDMDWDRIRCHVHDDPEEHLRAFVALNELTPDDELVALYREFIGLVRERQTVFH